jgi:hypothetical protein
LENPKGSNHFADLAIYKGLILKLNLNRVWECGLDSSGSHSVHDSLGSKKFAPWT